VRANAGEVDRNPDELETSIYHNIDIKEDREAAPAVSKRLLESYRMMDYSPARGGQLDGGASPRPL
jgi:hypothetical protein